jgi:dipeptide/tripeptide permease
MDEKPKSGLSWKFPKVFWIANFTELLERLAYYGAFLFMVAFLTEDVGFTDVESGTLVGGFSCFLYFMPTFLGALADKIGFRKALSIAFLLGSSGYTLLGAIPEKWAAILALVLIMLGGAIVKPVISGTTAKCSTDANRARAFSLFYMAVNVGSTISKIVADPIRIAINEMDLGFTGFQAINLLSGVVSFFAFLVVLAAFKTTDTAGEGKSFGEILNGLGRVLCNIRFMCLIIIIGGFWAIQGQLYSTMPKYLFRMVGDFSKPGWIAIVNPLTVTCLVVLITQLVRRLKPVTSISIGMFIIPFSALPVALAPNLGTERIPITLFSTELLSLHPIELMLVIGIFMQGTAECFLSPRFLEFASKQAPPGEVGLYMGYSHLTTAWAWLFGFVASGFLLDEYCPAPDVVAAMPEAERAHAYDHAHYIWYFWIAVGITAFLALMVFKFVTDRIDAKKKAEQTEEPSGL